MPKSKKKKPNARQQAGTEYNSIVRYVQQLERLNTASGEYSRTLHLSVEAERDFLEMEEKQNWAENILFRAYMLRGDSRVSKLGACLLFSPGSTNIPDALPEFSLESLRLYTKANALLVMQNILDDCVEGKFSTKEFLDRLPNHFYNDYSNFCDIPCSSSLATVVSWALNWDEILGGSNIAAWCRNLMRIFNALFAVNKDETEILNSIRDEILLSLGDAGITCIRSILSSGAGRLRKMFGDKPEALAFISSLEDAWQYWHSSAGLTDDLPFVFLPKPSAGGEQVIAMAYLDMSAKHLLRSWRVISDISQVLKHYDLAFISYAWISLMAEYNTILEAPGVVQTLSVISLFSSFARNLAHYDSEWPDESFDEDAENDDIISIDLSSSCRLNVSNESPGALLGLGDNKLEAEMLGIDSVSLAQVVCRESGVLPCTSMFCIRKSLLNSLVRGGIGENEAYATAGFIAGLSRINGYARMVFATIHLFEEEPDKKEESVRQALDSEHQQRMSAVEARERMVEESSHRAEKRVKVAEYRAEKAEKELETLRAKLSEQQKQLNRLAAEKAAAEEELEELRVVAVCEDGEAEDAEDAATGVFPSDVGSDRKIAVFGGSQNWVREQQLRFPNVTFADVDTQPNVGLLAGADVIICNVFVMKHKFFNIVQREARRLGKPIHYISRRGINNGSRDILAFGSAE